MAHSKYARTKISWKPSWDYRKLAKSGEPEEPLRGRKVQKWIGRRWRDRLRLAINEETDLDNEADVIVH